MNKTLLIIVALLCVLIGGLFVLTHYNYEAKPIPDVTIRPFTDVKQDDEPFVCDGDARICPDGSSVGRMGPRCEFAQCPSPDATEATVTTYLGGTATALTVSVSPKEVISDSRCPATVTCIWAGTVEVKTTLSTPVSHGEHVLTLGTPQMFGDYIVTLIGATPEKKEEAIADSSYRFTYEIVKQ